MVWMGGMYCIEAITLPGQNTILLVVLIVLFIPFLFLLSIVPNAVACHSYLLHLCMHLSSHIASWSHVLPWCTPCLQEAGACGLYSRVWKWRWTVSISLSPDAYWPNLWSSYIDRLLNIKTRILSGEVQNGINDDNLKVFCVYYLLYTNSFSMFDQNHSHSYSSHFQ